MAEREKKGGGRSGCSDGEKRRLATLLRRLESRCSEHLKWRYFCTVHCLELFWRQPGRSFGSSPWRLTARISKGKREDGAGKQKRKRNWQARGATVFKVATVQGLICTQFTICCVLYNPLGVGLEQAISRTCQNKWIPSQRSLAKASNTSSRQCFGLSYLDR